MKRELRVAATAGALAVVLALALAACGGGDDSDSVASLTETNGQTTTNGSQAAAAGSRDWEEAQLEYARCMRAHGVDFPDPVNGRFELRARRGDQRKVQAAQEACREILARARPPISEEQEAEMRDAALAFAKCMREHGVDMPDPTFPEGGGTLMQVRPGEKGNPKVEEAQKACQPILEAAQPDDASASNGSS